MADDGPALRGSGSLMRTVWVVGIPAVLFAVALALPSVLALHELIPALFVALAAGVPLAHLYTQRSRARGVEDGIRQLSRGELGRALPVSDDDVYAGIFTELESLRRTFQGQLKDMAISTDDQDRVLTAARRNIEELALTVDGVLGRVQWAVTPRALRDQRRRAPARPAASP